MELFEKLALYFEYPFVRYALIVGVLISLCSSLLGVTFWVLSFYFLVFYTKYYCNKQQYKPYLSLFCFI